MKRTLKYEKQFHLKRPLITLDSFLKSNTENVFSNFVDSFFLTAAHFLLIIEMLQSS